MKRWIRLAIIAGVIAALVVALVLTQRNPAEPEPVFSDEELEQFAADRVTIIDLERASIERIEVDRSGDVLALNKLENDRFYPEYAYDVEFVGSRTDRIVGSVVYLSSNRVIDESPTDLAVYGLDSPETIVTVLLEDNAELKLLIGNAVPSGGSFYVTTSETDSVYSVASTWISPFRYDLDDLRNKSLPQIDPAAFVSLSINTASGVPIRVSPNEDPDPGLGSSLFVITEPYQREYGVATQWLEETITSLAEVSIIRYVDDNPRDLSVYGLDPPVASFEARDSENVIAMNLGDRTDDGRYARLPGGGSVFVAVGTEQIISTDPYSTISPFVYIVGIDLVDRIEVDARGTRYTATFEREPSPDPEEDPIETFYWDGEEMEEDLFRDLYQWMIGLLVDAERVEPATGEPELSITYFLNDGRPEVTVSFVPYNANYYAAFQGDLSEFLISRSKIERLFAALENPTSIQ